MKHLAQELAIAPDSKIKLAKIDPEDTHGVEKSKAAHHLKSNLERLSVLQYLLYAEAKRALLVVLQGIDAGGKDGTIRHVMSGLNPQGVVVTPFKVPEGAEKRHDYLWRVHNAVPEQGSIGIFNRSHYEDVLVVRVHNLVPKQEWEGRYERINQFEKLLNDGGTTIVKVFWHVSKEEQRKRLQSRSDDPQKRWKFSRADIQERGYWDAYQQAYEAAMTRCNSRSAPWYIVPANHRWYRNLVVSRILRKTLERMAPQYPPAEEGLEGLVVE